MPAYQSAHPFSGLSCQAIRIVGIRFGDCRKRHDSDTGTGQFAAALGNDHKRSPANNEFAHLHHT